MVVLIQQDNRVWRKEDVIVGRIYLDKRGRPTVYVTPTLGFMVDTDGTLISSTLSETARPFPLTPAPLGTKLVIDQR